MPNAVTQQVTQMGGQQKSQQQTVQLYGGSEGMMPLQNGRSDNDGKEKSFGEMGEVSQI